MALLNILHFSSLYPNPFRPVHGVFVEQRLLHLLATGEVQARVVAPVPHPPWSRHAVPLLEQRHGVTVHHPPFFHIPGLGMYTAPLAMAAAALPLLRRLEAEEPFDLLDAHYFYPDGVAAAWLADRLGKPLVITGRGSDLNLLPRHGVPRWLIRRAALRADAIVTVSQALQQPLLELGIAPQRLTTLRNGVDLDLFQPLDRDTARRGLQCRQPTLLMVGHLIPRKGCARVIEAMTLLPEAALMIVGEGPLESELRHLVQQWGLAARVRFMGVVPHLRMKEYYSAADALVLASSREGWANCLLESMACGTPVVATAVWGAPEVVGCAEAGILMADDAPATIARCCRALLARPPERAHTRAYAQSFSWQATSRGQLALFRSVLAGRR